MRDWRKNNSETKTCGRLWPQKNRDGRMTKISEKNRAPIVDLRTPLKRALLSPRKNNISPVTLTPSSLGGSRKIFRIELGRAKNKNVEDKRGGVTGA